MQEQGHVDIYFSLLASRPAIGIDTDRFHRAGVIDRRVHKNGVLVSIRFQYRSCRLLKDVTWGILSNLYIMLRIGRKFLTHRCL